MGEGSRPTPNVVARSTRVRRAFSLQDPVVPILTLAGIFDALAGNGIHAVLLIAAAAVLLRDAWVGPVEEVEPSSRVLPAPPGWFLLLLALLYAVLIGDFGRYSWPGTVAVLAPAAAGLALAWRAPDPKPAASPVGRRGVIAWSSVFVALALWELTQLLLQPSLTTDSYAHPTISVMTDPVLASHVGRAIVLFAWLAVGWWLLQRTAPE